MEEARGSEINPFLLVISIKGIKEHKRSNYFVKQHNIYYDKKCKEMFTLLQNSFSDSSLISYTSLNSFSDSSLISCTSLNSRVSENWFLSIPKNKDPVNICINTTAADVYPTICSLSNMQIPKSTKENLIGKDLSLDIGYNCIFFT